MTKHSHSEKSHPDKKSSKSSSKTGKPTHASISPDGLAQKTETPVATPSGWLGNEQFSGPQRRAAAAQIGATQGNHFLARLMQNEAVFSPQGLDVQRQPVDAEQAAREAFVARGPMPNAAGLDMQSATGIGGFNVRFDPSKSELLIRLRVGIDFRNSIQAIPIIGTLIPSTPDFAVTAVQLTNNFPDPAARIAEVQTNWQWNEAESTQWGQDYAQAADNSWGERHFFKSQRWPDVFANVNVQLDVHKGHQATDHCKATVFKVPEGSSAGPGAVVNSTAGNPTGSTGTFTSASLHGTFDFLDHRFTYPEGGTRVNQATAQDGRPGNTYLDDLIATFQRGRPTEGAPIEIIGHASATGSPSVNQSISQQRAQNIETYLKSHGQEIAGYRITAHGVGSEGADTDPSWRRVDLRVGQGGTQQTMNHETGHMLGLGDEYVVSGLVSSGTGGAVGTPVAHGALSQAMGGGVQGAVFENNDNIMSLGNAVRPQHYATFMEAINSVSPERFEYGGQGPAPTSGLIPDLIPPAGTTTEPTDMVA